MVGDSFDRQNIRFLDKTDDKYISKSPKETYSLIGCDAGMHSYTISWNGQLLGCQLLDAFSEKIRDSFQNAWDAFPLAVCLPPRPAKCSACQIRQHCSSCPASLIAEASHGGEVEYICRDAETEYSLFHKEI